MTVRSIAGGQYRIYPTGAVYAGETAVYARPIGIRNLADDEWSSIYDELACFRFEWLRAEERRS